VALQLLRLGRATRLLEVLLDLIGGEDLFGARQVDGEAEIDREIDVTDPLNAHRCTIL
jgi:hypothetical protein